VGLVPPGVVTVTWTVPAVPAGDVTVAVVAVLERMVPALAPKFTAVELARLVPVTMTCWPPAVGPELEVTEVTDGTPA